MDDARIVSITFDGGGINSISWFEDVFISLSFLNREKFGGRLVMEAMNWDGETLTVHMIVED